MWETAERRDLATSLTLRDVRGEGGPARGHVPSPLRAITGRKPRNETRPSGGEIAEKRLEGAECAGIGMLPAERSSMKVYIFIPGTSFDTYCLYSDRQVLGLLLCFVHKLALSDRQAARGRRDEGGVMKPMTGIEHRRGMGYTRVISKGGKCEKSSRRESGTTTVLVYCSCGNKNIFKDP